LVLSTVHSAEAVEEQFINSIYGVFDEGSIFIADNGTNNVIILYDNVGNSTKHYDSTVKEYNSGSFVMRNIQSGILVFAHPIQYDQYKLVIVTTDKVYRLIGVLQIISELEPVESVEVQPTSSVGADITKWDIPTEGKSDYVYVAPIEEHDPDTLDILFSVPQQIQWLYALNFDLTAIDTKIASEQDQRLPDVPINVQILNPIMEIVGTWNGTTDNFGVFGEKYYIVGNQMLGEYKLQASIEKENYTSVSKMVSFSVIPLATGSSSQKCPLGYMVNSTGFCECEPEYLNATGFCEVQ